MDRSIPVFNRVIVEQMNKRNQILHKKTLQNIRRGKRLVFLAPRHSNHSKAQQLQQQRKTNIEKENVILFNKMTRIFQKRNSQSKHAAPPSDRLSRNLMSHSQQQSFKEYKGNGRLSAIISFIVSDSSRKYPYNNQQIIRPQRNNRAISFIESQVGAAKSRTHSQSMSRRKTVGKAISNKLYKREMQIEDELFQVTIAHTNEGLLFQIQPLQGQDSYQLILSQIQSKELLLEFDNRLDLIASCLTKRFGKVQLVLPQNAQEDYKSGQRKQQRAASPVNNGSAKFNILQYPTNKPEQQSQVQYKYQQSLQQQLN